MKKHLSHLILFFIFILFFNCKNEKNANQPTIYEPPKSLNDSVTRFSIKSTREILIDQLYQELVSDSEELQKFEKMVNEVDPFRFNAEFNAYENKSKTYYSETKFLTDSIKDIVLKQKITTLIDKSKDDYETRANEINDLLKEISSKNQSLKDHHNVLKIVLTIPVIEKYQKVKINSKEKITEILNNQNKVIEKSIKLME